MAEILVLSADDVAGLLDLDDLHDALEQAFLVVSAGGVSMPDRTAAMVPGGGLTASMLVHVPGSGTIVSKLVSVFEHNHERGLPSHQAVITVFDAATGSPVALLDGTNITASRTAGGAAVSVRHLARPDATTLSIIGTGVQALAHARAVVRERPITGIRVAGRDETKTRSLAATIEAELGVTAMASGSVEACAAADIVCCTTHSPTPVIERSWLRPGTHVTSVGYNPDGFEVDAATVADSLVVVESLAAALSPFPAGAIDLTVPIAEGVIAADHVSTELGEVISGAKPGRTSPDQLTLYKSMGIAAQDAAGAMTILAAARAAGVGRSISL